MVFIYSSACHAKIDACNHIDGMSYGNVHILQG